MPERSDECRGRAERIEAEYMAMLDEDPIGAYTLSAALHAAGAARLNARRRDMDDVWAQRRDPS